MKDLELNVPEQITIPALDPWKSTGVLLKKDSKYKFEVIPHDQVWADGKLGEFTADGKIVPHLFYLYPFLRMPLVKWFALLGCINRKRSTYFKIGINLDLYSPPVDGELICFANDALGFKNFFYDHNNTGEIKLTITKIS